MAWSYLIGTSGFSYEDWRGYFYPQDLPKKEMLRYYAEHFPTVEVNATYYSLPGPATFYQMARKVPPGFQFVVKAHKDMTHAEEFLPEPFHLFRAALEPLQEAGMLGCVLGQFPWSFKATPENRTVLERFRDELPDLPVVVEFRNSGWVSEETYRAAAPSAVGLLLCGRAATEGADAADREGDVPHRLRPIPRPQCRQVVAARASLRAVRLPVQRGRAGGVGPADPGAGGRDRKDVFVFQQPL